MLKTAALLLLLAPATALATSVELPYQARLTDVNGSPINGQHTVTVRLYNSSDALIFTEPFINIDINNGYLAVQLGADPANYDLQHTVVGTAATIGVEIDTDGELSPRTPLGTVPFAATALEADHAAAADNATTVGGFNPNQFATTGTLNVSYTNCAWTACVDGGSSLSVCPSGKVMRGMDVSTADSQKPVGCTGTNHEDEYRSYCCTAQVTLIPN